MHFTQIYHNLTTYKLTHIVNKLLFLITKKCMELFIIHKFIAI